MLSGRQDQLILEIALAPLNFAAVHKCLELLSELTRSRLPVSTVR